MNKKNSDKNTVLCKECGTAIPQKFLDANFCNHCCALLPGNRRFIEEYFDRIPLDKKLDGAKRLFLKNEYVSAARLATIVLEKEIQRLIKADNLFGIDLITKAFSFEYDQARKKLLKAPVIKLNPLKTKTQRNEQEGMRFFCMGIMAGIRNIVSHSTAFIIPFRCLILITDIGFILREIIEGSTISYKDE